MMGVAHVVLYIYQYVYNNGRKNGWHAGSISNIDDTDYKCHDGTVPEVRTKVISGVVGASSSVTSIQVANLLRLFKIPQVQRLIPFTILRSLIITRDFLFKKNTQKRSRSSRRVPS